MEYIYAALLLHSAGKKITDANVKKVLDGAGVTSDAAKIKALVASLDGVNIEEAVKQTAVAPVAAAPAPGKGTEQKAEEKEEESEEDAEKKAEEAAEGLASLFG